MSDRIKGNVVPFAISPGRLRRGASLRMKGGRTVEAAELLRHAAETDDSVQGWLLLADCLEALHCHEQAAALCYRLITRPDAGAASWLALARSQLSLEAFPAAEDSLFHAVAAAPNSLAADEARTRLSAMETGGGFHQASRLPRLLGRAMAAWRADENALAQRRFRRAARIAPNPAELWLGAATLRIMTGAPERAWGLAARLLRREPDNIQARLLLSVAAWMLNRRRLALGLMEPLARFPLTPAQERTFLLAACRARDAHGLLRRYLGMQLRRMPCRVSLLLAQAREKLICRPEEARPYLALALRLDPENTWARAALRFPPEREHVDSLSPMACEAFRRALEAELAGPVPDALPPVDGWARAAWVWCFEQEDEALQRRMVEHLAASGSPAVRRWTVQLLTRRGVPESTCRHILQLLDDEGEGLPLLVGHQVAMARLGESAPPRVRFLRLALVESHGYCPASRLLPFAARAWQAMTPAQRHQACSPAGALWARAVTLTYLRTHDEDETERALCRALGPSRPWAERAARRMERRMGLRKGE